MARATVRLAFGWKIKPLGQGENTTRCRGADLEQVCRGTGGPLGQGSWKGGAAAEPGRARGSLKTGAASGPGRCLKRWKWKGKGREARNLTAGSWVGAHLDHGFLKQRHGDLCCFQINGKNIRWEKFKFYLSPVRKYRA